MKILCLHGCHQDAEIFRHKLSRVIKEFPEHHFVFAEGLHHILVNEGDDLPMRSWYEMEGSTLAEGKVEMASDADVILGFSQGCSVVMDLLHSSFCGYDRKSLSKLRGVILIGSAVGSAWEKVAVPSLHVAGTADTITPVDASLETAERCFDGAQVHLHAHGHVVPQSRNDLDAFNSFFKSLESLEDLDAIGEAIQEEIAQLQMVFGDGNIILHDKETGRIADVTFDLTEDPMPRAQLKFRCTLRYPSRPPEFVLEGPTSLSTVGWKARFERELHELAESMAGGPMLFQLFMFAKDMVEMKLNEVEAGVEEEEDAEADLRNQWKEEQVSSSAEHMVSEANLFAARVCSTERSNSSQFSSRGGGEWRFVIGLVGKPSAGKSTFFNSITAENDSAKVGAFPFTTIEPNVGTAMVGVPCKCKGSVGVARCGAAFGHSHESDDLRNVPVMIKDVAGLVQGAYQGRGKGNKFLNDLCDADVLVHIVDGAGSTMEDGTANRENEGDPSHDVSWVRDEIHMWIFDNVRSRWEAIAKKPSKLLSMFSGYHCRPDTVHLCIDLCGYPSASEALSKIPTWSPQDLHNLVAVFIRVRFPMLFALNKDDIDGFEEKEAAVRSAFPSDRVVRMSAQMQCNVDKALHEKLLSVTDTGVYLAKEDSPSAVACADYMNTRKTTGTTAALSTAFSMRQTIRIFPVEDLVTLAASRGDDRSVLGKCLIMKIGSTVEDLFSVMVASRAASGKFVRCEYRDLSTEDEKSKILRRDDELRDGMVVKLLTNRITGRVQ